MAFSFCFAPLHAARLAQAQPPQGAEVVRKTGWSMSSDWPCRIEKEANLDAIDRSPLTLGGYQPGASQVIEIRGSFAAHARDK